MQKKLNLALSKTLTLSVLGLGLVAASPLLTAGLPFGAGLSGMALAGDDDRSGHDSGDDHGGGHHDSDDDSSDHESGDHGNHHDSGDDSSDHDSGDDHGSAGHGADDPAGHVVGSDDHTSSPLPADDNNRKKRKHGKKRTVN